MPATDRPTFKKKFWILGLFLLVAGLFFGAVLGRLTAKKDTGDLPAKTATSSQAQTKDGKTADNVVMAVEAVRPIQVITNQSISANGVVVGKDVAQVGARLSGVAIERVLVEVGDWVQAGQVLAILDDSTATQEVIAAQAASEQAAVGLAKARADLARVEPLITIDAISREQYDAYKTAVLQADAGLKSAQARLASLANSKNNTKVIAPVSGIISDKQAQVGMLAGGTTLFSIIKDGVLEWQATLDPSQATKIALGQPVKIMVGEEVVAGKVARLAPTANNAREIVVHVALPKGVPLKSGMYQTGEFILSQAVKPAVPVSALLSSDGYDYVLTLSPYKNGTYQVARTKVIAGQRQGEMVALDLPENTPLDGLMVRQSGSFLGDGDVVKVVNEIPIQDSAQPSAPPAQDTAVPASLARPQAQGQ